MKRLLIGVMLLAGVATGVAAQHHQQHHAQEVTLFSEPGFSGARFTVTGPRTTLDLPFIARSALLQGGGAWEFCPMRDYRGPCTIVDRNERDLRLDQRIQSVRPASAGPAPLPAPGAWRDIGRAVQRPGGRETVIRVTDKTPFQEVMLCAEAETLRLRSAEVLQPGGRWRAFTVPREVPAGQCSRATALLGEARPILQLRIRYAPSPASSRPAVLVVRALPYVRPQPR